MAATFSCKSARVAHSVVNETLIGEIADEFLQRLEAGEQPDVEEYAARHPQAAEELRQVLAALMMMDRPQRADVLQADEPTPTLLADFRILRKLGRGGMGGVY